MELPNNVINRDNPFDEMRRCLAREIALVETRRASDAMSEQEISDLLSAPLPEHEGTLECASCKELAQRVSRLQRVIRDIVEMRLDDKPLYMAREEHILKRPTELEADVVRFQNNKEKWIAFIGMIDGRPYEIFTGIADDDEGIFCPKSVNKGKIIKVVEGGTKRYDFQFINRRGFKTTIEGLSEKFNPEFWNYAKLISGVLRYGMPIDQVIKLVSSLELNNETVNTWKVGVERALKKYLPGAESSPVEQES